jgi:hypothetical protein
MQMPWVTPHNQKQRTWKPTESPNCIAASLNHFTTRGEDGLPHAASPQRFLRESLCIFLHPTIRLQAWGAQGLECQHQEVPDSPCLIPGCSSRALTEAWNKACTPSYLVAKCS